MFNIVEAQPQGKRRAEDEDDDYGLFVEPLRLYNKVKQVNEVDAYIDGHIGALSNYRNLLHFLRTGEEKDTCRIWLDTPGGYLDTTMALVETLQKTEVNTQVIISGRAYSGGSVIALAAPQLIVSDNASMMIHHASYGTGGKVPDVGKMVRFTEAQVDSIYRKVYKDFLTPDEIEQVLKGQDFWFNSEEITRRLEARHAAQEKQLAAMQKAQKKAQKTQSKVSAD